MIAALGSVCSFLNGGTPSRDEARYFTGTTPWITGADITGPTVNSARSFITEEAIRHSATNRVPAGTVLLVTRTSVGKVAVAGVDLCFSQDVTGLMPDPKKLDSGYLMHFLKTQETGLVRLARGATIKGVTRDAIADLEIPLPPLPEQRLVAGRLDAAEALRARRRHAIAELGLLTQSTFLEMFGNPVTNPKGWPARPFGDVCETRLGKMLDQKRQSSLDRRKYLRNANVKWFRFDLEDLSVMDFDSSDRATFRLEVGDLLICEGGEPGRAAIWRGELEECYYQKALHRGRPRRDVATADYLVWLLWFFVHGGGLGDYVTSATIAHLTGEKLKAMSIPLPPISNQLAFGRSLDALQQCRDTQHASLVGLDELISVLHFRAFGES